MCSPSLRQNIGCTLTMAYGNCNKASIISITKVKSTKVGLEETERNKALTAVGVLIDQHLFKETVIADHRLFFENVHVTARSRTLSGSSESA